MPSPDRNPIILTQNRLSLLLEEPGERCELYRRVLRRRLAHAGDGRLRIPAPRGLRLRLSGKPFHATPELFFQDAGTTRFDFPKEAARVGPGDSCLVPAGMPHGERWAGRAFLNLIVMFQPESFSIHLGYLDRGKGPLRCGPVDRFFVPDRFPVLRYAEEMTELAAEGSPDDPLLRGLYTALLARLLRGVAAPRSERRSRDDLMARCREMIDVYYSRLDFSVAWLARELRCSPDHLSRRFRAATGSRIIEAIHRRRVEHARRLLLDSDMNVAEAAWACGFSQPSYFNRIFRALTGTTPKAFRHQELGRVNEPVLSPDNQSPRNGNSRGASKTALREFAARGEKAHFRRRPGPR